MRAFEIQGAFGYDNLRLVERPDPAPLPGQVLMRVRAVSLNFRDHLTVLGNYNPRQTLPLVPCSDGAGEIVAIGAGVTRVAVGDRVMATFAQEWLGGRPTIERFRSTLGGPRDGLLRELAILPEQAVVKTPAYLSDREAATLPCAALTAWNALTKFACVRAGQRVLVLGTGGVSIFGLAFARSMGCDVVVTSSSDEKLERAKALGATYTVNYKTTPEWGKEVRRLTGDGVDLVLEVGGAGTLDNSIRACAIGGMIALIGVLGGQQKPPNLTPVFMNELRVQGLLVGSRDDFEQMNRGLEQTRIKPVISDVFAFTDAHQAFKHLAAGGHFGKVVIDV